MYVIKCQGKYWSDAGDWSGLSDAYLIEGLQSAVRYVLDNMVIDESVSICLVKSEPIILSEYILLKEVV